MVLVSKVFRVFAGIDVGNCLSVLMDLEMDGAVAE